MIVETDASDIGYGGILKQRLESDSQEQLVRFHSGLWLGAQQNYSTIKKEILSIVLCVLKFQDDLFYKKILLRIDCKSAKEIPQNDVKNLVSKQIFARWQSILSAFDFQIEFIKGENNSLPDFLTKEFLHEKGNKTIILQEDKMISSKGKHNGKGIRRAKDYQLEVPIQIPTQNQFQTLAHFPPLPYKTVLLKPA